MEQLLKLKISIRKCGRIYFEVLTSQGSISKPQQPCPEQRMPRQSINPILQPLQPLVEGLRARSCTEHRLFGDTWQCKVRPETCPSGSSQGQLHSSQPWATAPAGRILINGIRSSVLCITVC